MKYSILYFFLSVCYIGKIKYAPGTMASILTVFFWYLVDFQRITQIVIVLSVTILGLCLCFFYSMYNRDKDPAFIVLDEVAGMSIALLMVPKVSYLFLISFLLFRALDIFKPGLISSSEKIGNGIGIMLDDVISGIISLSIVHIIISCI